MDKKYIAVPGRLESVATDGQIAGAKDIYDDDLGLEQSVINGIVFNSVVKTSVSVTSSAVTKASSGSIKLTASSETLMDSITITKEGVAEPIGEGNNTKSIAPTDTNVSGIGVTKYTTSFVKGGFSRNVITNVGAIFFSTGVENMGSNAKMWLKTSPAGTYNVNVAESGTYVWFSIPSTMSISKATMSGFDFPLESPTEVTIEGVAYKSYRSSNTYDDGTLTIVIS